jgi:phosphoribosyl 1,2-cyclic phosphodiesterase
VLRFKSLGSGSAGNATLIEAHGPQPFRLLVDCGFGLKQLTHRLALAHLTPHDIDAVFVTHEHGDHIGCARGLSLGYRIPVWMSHGTHVAIGSPDFEGHLHIARDGEAIDLGALQILPFTVPHDAREPLQLSCTDGNIKLGVLTDLGHATPHVLSHLAACDSLLLECNHDEDLLSKSAYPAFLKQRIAGPHGHLSNTVAAEILGAVRHSQLRHLVAAHLSAQNNQPALVRTIMAATLSCADDDIVVARAEEGTGWLSV